MHVPLQWLWCLSSLGRFYTMLRSRRHLSATSSMPEATSSLWTYSNTCLKYSLPTMRMSSCKKYILIYMNRSCGLDMAGSSASRSVQALLIHCTCISSYDYGWLMPCMCVDVHACSRDAARDCIDLHRSVLTPLASNGNGGKLYVYKMNSGFWTQVKNAG